MALVIGLNSGSSFDGIGAANFLYHRQIATAAPDGEGRVRSKE